MGLMSAFTGPLRGWTRVATVLAAVAFAACDNEVVLRAPSEIDHVLRVQGDGAGSGIVTTPEASPPLSCSITRGALTGECARAYPSNSAIRLVATPNATSTFLGWSGACAGTDQCVVDMSQERAVTAGFTARLSTTRH
jgi:hypothetical protein